ncbi:uncharacterized protein AB675_4953 [Cyphellophora attinorum]|uniref:J domain-containing protein n=1 Tax=Cyphellophora attinorum TaxID=1664694 RepID=A0A0N1NWX0_9EURO|nr:uncharacterized protein AB675_4953 [Phialophora attinorum]KPI34286.1 hypothetical protein AB675_4953 [Phialophora attinorum]
MDKSTTRSPAPHEVLGVERHATARQVKTAYRKLSLQFHPDKNPHSRGWATAKFKELNEAYETMKTSNVDEIEVRLTDLENMFEQIHQKLGEAIAQLEKNTKMLENILANLEERKGRQGL